MPWNVLHPKVKAALIAAVITTIVNVAAAVTDAYPNEAWVGYVSVFVPLVVAYLKRAPTAEASLADERLQRLLDKHDEYDDLSLAEIKAIEARGRDHQAEVREALHAARVTFDVRRREAKPNGG